MPGGGDGEGHAAFHVITGLAFDPEDGLTGGPKGVMEPWFLELAGGVRLEAPRYVEVDDAGEGIPNPAPEDRGACPLLSL